MEDFRILDPDPYNNSTGSASLVVEPELFWVTIICHFGSGGEMMFFQAILRYLPFLSSFKNYLLVNTGNFLCDSIMVANLISQKAEIFQR